MSPPVSTSIEQTPPKRSGGTRIPRLQELSFLEVTMLGVADGVGFEEIRKRLVNHMVAMRENSPATGNIATFRIARDDPKRYVSNVSAALKELMRLGLVEGATVPSSARSALSYGTATFAASREGEAWARLLRDDPRSAYDELLQLLWRAHPQFVAFLRAVSNEGLVIPLAQWGELPEPRTRERYLSFLTSRVVEGLRVEPSGWTASGSDIRQAVEGYLKDRYEDAEGRGRPEPYPRNQDYIRACEEALVKFAFTQCGVAIDYVSQEILRRWTKELGVVNFSYHVPRLNALRFWPTAAIDESGEQVLATRRTGKALVQSAIEVLPEAYEEVRRQDRSRSLWVPIYRVRASVCWKLKIPDAVFDHALVEVLAGDSDREISFAINVDMAQYGSVPPLELPLRLKTNRGLRTYYAMSLMPKRKGAN